MHGASLHQCQLGEVVPAKLRAYLRWDWRHDLAAAQVMRDHEIELPQHRELIRQLAYMRVMHPLVEEVPSPDTRLAA
jgi:hypothetical protein